MSSLAAPHPEPPSFSAPPSGGAEKPDYTQRYFNLLRDLAGIDALSRLRTKRETYSAMLGLVDRALADAKATLRPQDHPRDPDGVD